MTHSNHSPDTRKIAVLLTLCVGLLSCAFDEQRQIAAEVDHDSVGLLVLNEAGRPVAGAQVDITLDLDGDGELDTLHTNDLGTVVMDIDGPVIATVSAPGAVPEPVAMSPTDRLVTVRLWDRVGPTGVERHALHFGGDVMLGRRYLTEDSATVPVVDEATARVVVDDLAPITRSADWTVVNLETVVGRHEPSGALDAKRFLLQSTPYVTSVLDEMGVDVVTLGNNHAYDWGDAGISSTIDALDRAGIGYVGAGRSADEAIAGRLDQIGDLTVGTLSFTTVNGSFVNDQLPGADVPLPTDLDVAEAWQYQERMFGFDSDDERVAIPEGGRRIGEVWTLFEELEGELGEDVVVDVWNAITEVYPELQDWVARRGHGGAAGYDRSAVESEIGRLRAAGADLVVVQVHGGFQFAEVASAFMKQVAHQSIDAGADMIIAHHPHVLQGLEWYRGKLVAYSLGNLVFDQAFLGTFPSMIVRTVTEGQDVLEVRLLPLMVDRYRPVPVVGSTARTVLRTVDLRSSLPATSARVDGLRVGTVLDDTTELGVERASVRFDRNSGVVERGRQPTVLPVPLDLVGRASLPPCALVRADRLPPGAEIGVDLFDWGRFDDDTADDRRLLPLNWKVSSNRDAWSKVDGASGRTFDVALELESDPNSVSGTQIGARIDISRHRRYDTDGRPVDGTAAYEVVLDVKRDRGESPSLRFVTFDFDDTDPTADPDTHRLLERSFVLDAPADGGWHHVSVDVPAELFADGPGGKRPNVATLLIDVPPSLLGTVAIDNVRIIEWRGRTATGVPAWVDADLVRGEPSDVLQLDALNC